jgi:hypothetical protein
MKVDLRLAVNYLPACACMAKMLVFVLAVSMITQGHEVRAYTVLAAVLYLDRLCTSNIIFDANSILLAVYFSHVHALIRTGSEAEANVLLMMCLQGCWMMSCGVLLYEPPMLRRILERRSSLERLGPTGGMLLVIVSISFFHNDPEHIAVQGWRALAFALQCFAWVYIVGIDNMQGADHLKQNSYQFITRMAPLLYAPFWTTVFFFQAAAVCLAVQYIKRYNPQIIPLYQPLDPQSPYPDTAQSQASAESDEGENLEELFRQARQKTSGPAQV